MKLYNKVFGAFYSLLSVCYLNASEPSSSIWESLSRDASPAEFSKIQEFVAAPSLKIKIIDVNTITSWVRTKSPEKFSEFETKFGGPELLIANPSKIAEIFKNGQKQYLEKTKEGFFEDGSHYIEIQGIQPDKLNLCNIELNGYIDDIAKTEFGRKVLTTYCLCKYCLKDNFADTPILSVLIAEDECAVTKGGNDLYLKFDLHNAKEKISQIRGNFISAENRSLDVLPFSVEECLCHEFIHMIHDMLNIRDTQCFNKESIVHLPLFKELFINGFETIKETANEVLELIYQDKCGFFDILEQEINKFKRDIYNI